MLVTVIIIAVVILGIVAFILSLYKKVPQGKAIVRTGAGGTIVEYEQGIFVIPFLNLLSCPAQLIVHS